VVVVFARGLPTVVVVLTHALFLVSGLRASARS